MTHTKRHTKRTMKRRGGSMLSTAVVPFALLGVNSVFGKKTKSNKRTFRRSRVRRNRRRM
jgi:hypothetical protein